MARLSTAAAALYRHCSGVFEQNRALWLCVCICADPHGQSEAEGYKGPELLRADPRCVAVYGQCTALPMLRQCTCFMAAVCTLLTFNPCLCAVCGDV